jgi:benzoate-CoA ligase family protein
VSHSEFTMTKHSFEANATFSETLNLTSYFLDENIRKGRGSVIALRFRDQKYTYGDLYRLTNQVGNALKELGVEMEDRVYLTLGDSPELVASFYGAIKIGATVALAYTFFSARDYAFEIRYVRPKVIIADSSSIQNIRIAIEGSPYPRVILVLGKEDSGGRNEFDFHERVDRAGEELEAEETTRNDIAEWKFSGGTTGHRKAIPHRHWDPVWHFEQFDKIVHYRQEDVVLSIPKMFFGYGRTGTIVYPFRVGASAVLFPERASAELIFELIQRHRPTILLQVPTMIKRMVEMDPLSRPDFSSIRMCISSGEALSAELHQKWKEMFGCEVLNQIGSAELYYSYIIGRHGEIAPGCVGRLLDGFESKIVDEEGRELPDGEVGALMIKGDCAGFEYRYHPEKTRKTFRGEWVLTDDLFKKDMEGRFYFVGRRDELLKVSGYFVSPMEIEQCVATHPGVAECAVVGVKDRDGLDQTKAFIVLKKGIIPSSSLAGEFQRYCKEHLSAYKYPRLVEFVDELPKTGLEKIDRFQLTQRSAAPEPQR